MRNLDANDLYLRRATILEIMDDCRISVLPSANDIASVAGVEHFYILIRTFKM